MNESSVAEEPLISASMNDKSSEDEETIRVESVCDGMFEFEPTSTSTPAQRKRKACEHKSSDSSMGEEPLRLVHSASIEEQEETPRLGDSEDDEDKS